MSQAAQRGSFFRQSGWLMFANVAQGALMWLVHFLNKFLPAGDYGVFGACLAVAMLVPMIPLQMVLTQQTAKALAQNHERQLSGVFRMMWLVITVLWLAGSVVVLILQRSILESWQMTSPMALWITLPIVLFQLWLPLFFGLLQGQQNFLWLGWSMMTNGFGRILFAALAVVALGWGAAGMLTGVVLGLAAGVGMAAWESRALWLMRPEPFDWRSVSAQILPVLLAFLGFQALFTTDTLFVKAYFPATVSDFYVSAGTLSRALMWLVLPLASVMFPRLVHSAAKSENTDLTGLVFWGTGILAVVGSLGLWVLGPLVIRLVYKASFVAVASSVLPWYAFAMVPLALANVLLNHLLARPASKLPLALGVVGLALVYLFALTRFHGSLVAVLQTMGVCNLLLLALSGWFSWRRGAEEREEQEEENLA
jgi:O-antigen/teichoic acid export membrane protein